MIARLVQSIDQTTRARFLKFCGIGIVAFSVDVIVFQAMVSTSGSSLYVARIVSFVIATTAAWWLNRTFTFKDTANARLDLEWARFMAANLVGGSVNYAMFVILIASVPLMRTYPILALAAGSLSGVAFNFTAYRRYVFRTDAGLSGRF